MKKYIAWLVLSVFVGVSLCSCGGTKVGVVGRQVQPTNKGNGDSAETSNSVKSKISDISDALKAVITEGANINSPDLEPLSYVGGETTLNDGKAEFKSEFERPIKKGDEVRVEVGGETLDGKREVILTLNGKEIICVTVNTAKLETSDMRKKAVCIGSYNNGSSFVFLVVIDIGGSEDDIGVVLAACNDKQSIDDGYEVCCIKEPSIPGIEEPIHEKAAIFNF